MTVQGKENAPYERMDAGKSFCTADAQLPRLMRCVPCLPVEPTLMIWFGVVLD